MDEKGNEFWPSVEEYKTLPDKYIDRVFPLQQTLKTHYFLFTLINDTPAASTFFIYSTPQEEIYVRTRSIHLKEEVDVLPIVFSTGYDRDLYPIKQAPGDTVQVQLKMILSRHPHNFPFYFVVPGSQVNEFTAYWNSMFEEKNEIILFLGGMILMMGIYIFIKYLQIRTREYIFYAGYILFLFMFFLLKIIQHNYSSNFFSEELLYSFAYRGTQSAAYCMYFAFFQHFFNTSKTLPSLHKQLRAAIFILGSYILLDLALIIAPVDSRVLFQYRLWDGVRIVLMVWTIYSVIFISLHRKKLTDPRLSTYLTGGVSALVFFALVSMILSINQGEWITFMPGPLRSPLFYFELGIIIELLFFSAGLGYKNRMDEIGKVKALEALQHEGERMEFEQYKAGIEAREAERHRIATDLHDGVGGMLSGVRFSLEGLRGRVEMHPKEEVLYDKSLNQLGDSIHELRKVAHDLMPDVLLKQGLLSALKDYCQSLNDLEVLRVVLQSVGEEKRLRTDCEVTLYRVIQELLTNAIRHAKASEVLVQLVFAENSVSITAEDNGLGFDVEKIAGYGLKNIHSRVAQLKGKIDFKSSPGNGTSVYMEIPFSSNL